MKIYLKFGIAITIALACLIIILYAATNAIMLGGFEQIEQNDATENVERMVYALVDDINTLDTVALEWASRSTTRDFVKDGEADPVIDDEIFWTIGINYIIVTDPSGTVLEMEGYDLDLNEPVAVPDSLLSQVGPETVLGTHDSPISDVMGVLVIPDGHLMIVSRPIVSSNGDDVIGTLIMARYLDAREIARLSALTSLTIDVSGYDSETGPAEVLGTYNTLTGLPFIQLKESDIVTVSAPSAIETIDEDTIYGYGLIRDIYGNPALVMRATMPRDTYAEGRSTSLYFFLSLLAAGLLISVLLILLLEKTILSRLSFLSSTVGGIGRMRDFNARVNVPGDDEVSQLATSINGMLVELETSQNQLQCRLDETEERYRIFFNRGNDAVFVNFIDENGNPEPFLEVNQAACDRLGYSREEMLGRTPLDIVSPYYLRNTIRILKQIMIDAHALYETEFVTKKGEVFPFEVSAHTFEHLGKTAVLSMARDIKERKEIENLKRNAFEQIEKNMEQFAVLNDHIRNPLQAIVGLALLNDEDDKNTVKILEQAAMINTIVDQLDQGWIESGKIRDWLRKYYEFE